MARPISAQQPTPSRTLTPGLLGVMWVAFYAFGTFFLTYATLVSVGQLMGLTSVTAGTVLTIMMVAVVAVQPIVPSLNSRLGARTTYLIALGFQTLGHVLVLIPGAPFATFLLGSAISGLGFGIVVVVGTAVVPSTVAPDRLGKALGFYGATTASAPAIGAPVGLWLITVVSPAGLHWVSIGLLILALPAVGAVPAAQLAEQTGSRAEHNQTTHSPRIQVAGLVTVLLPTAFVLTVFGLVLAFGPPADTSPAQYIAVMQVSVIIGRFLGSAILDRHAAVPVMVIALGMTLLGLVATAVVSAGWGLLLAMAVLGFGTGGVQSASLVAAFQQAGTPARGSVAWNMTFDIGLGIAGLVGGLGFTYLGAQPTYLLCAGLLLITSAVFAWYFRPRPSVHVR